MNKIYTSILVILLQVSYINSRRLKHSIYPKLGFTLDQLENELDRNLQKVTKKAVPTKPAPAQPAPAKPAPTQLAKPVAVPAQPAPAAVPVKPVPTAVKLNPATNTKVSGNANIKKATIDSATKSSSINSQDLARLVLKIDDENRKAIKHFKIAEKGGEDLIKLTHNYQIWVRNGINELIKTANQHLDDSTKLTQTVASNLGFQLVTNKGGNTKPIAVPNPTVTSKVVVSKPTITKKTVTAKPTAKASRTAPKSVAKPGVLVKQAAPLKPASIVSVDAKGNQVKTPAPVTAPADVPAPAPATAPIQKTTATPAPAPAAKTTPVPAPAATTTPPSKSPVGAPQGKKLPATMRRRNLGQKVQMMYALMKKTRRLLVLQQPKIYELVRRMNQIPEKDISDLDNQDERNLQSTRKSLKNLLKERKSNE